MKSNTIKHILEQLEKAEKLKRDSSRYEGRLEGILQSLKEFGCSSIKGAKRELENYKVEIQKSEEELERLSAEFDSKYSSKLENL